MWRYYELLTDLRTEEIEQKRLHEHPMDSKKFLAARIVQDFHGEQAAKDAGANWAKQFQKDEVPEDVETVVLKFSAVVQTHSSRGLENVAIRVDKMLHLAGLADSVADGRRKIEQRAVRINGEIAGISHPVDISKEFVVRAGKKLKGIRVEDS